MPLPIPSASSAGASAPSSAFIAHSPGSNKAVSTVYNKAPKNQQESSRPNCCRRLFIFIDKLTAAILILIQHIFQKFLSCCCPFKDEF